MSSLRKNEFEDVPLHVIHLDQDDPKKCTARRLQKYGHAILHTNIKKSPKRGFLLDPKAGLLLGPDDKNSIDRGAAIVALDCSWKQIDSCKCLFLHSCLMLYVCKKHQASCIQDCCSRSRSNVESRRDRSLLHT